MSLLPPNATPEERSLSDGVARISDVPVTLRELWNPDTCPESLLPWLAWALSVDTWHADWSEEKKRQVIKSAIAVHRRKGTPYAVEEAFKAVNISARVEEWPEYGGDPYKFKLAVDVLDEGLDEAAYSTINQVISQTKNVRSHLDSLDVYLSGVGAVPVVGTVQQGGSLDVYPWIPPTPESNSGVLCCSGVAVYSIIDVESGELSA